MSLLSSAGLIELTFGANSTAAAVAAATSASYVLVYTPLKTRTSLATLVGAVPGALPPVIGWAAATGDITLPALVLFGIVFFWQMPHFLAIAWMYRDDYARAGIPLLPVLEPDGRRTGQQALLYAAALWPVSLLPALVGLADAPYSVVATGLGFVFIGLARSSRASDRWSARGACSCSRSRTCHCSGAPSSPIVCGSERLARIFLHLNAILNGTSAVFLVTGYVLIRRGHETRTSAACSPRSSRRRCS